MTRSKDKKGMCVSEKNVKEIVDAKIDLLSARLDSNFVDIKKDLEFIKDQTVKTNGRVTATEGKVRHLEALNDKKELVCPFRNTIEILSRKQVSEGEVAKMIEKLDLRRAADQQLQYRRLQVIAGLVVAAVAVLGFLL